MNAGSPNRSLDEAARLAARIAELRPEARRLVAGQHLITKALLKRFAVPKGSAGYQLCPFDLHYPDRYHKPKNVRECAKVEHFVPYASASAEDLWGRLETRLPAAAAAVERGDVFDNDQHVTVLKDMIALHWVRSLNYHALHHRIFETVFAEHRTALLTEKADLVRAAHLERGGLHLVGPQGLTAVVDRLLQPHWDDYESGAHFRVRIEEAFERAKEIIGACGLQIVAPESGAYLLGDNPALTICEDNGRTTFGMALGDSTAVLLPFGPKHLLVGRAPSNEFLTVSAPVVDRLNRLQIEAAHRRVYLRPRSGQDTFVQDYLAGGGRHR